MRKLLLAALLAPTLALAQSNPPVPFPPTGNGSGVVVQTPGSTATRALAPRAADRINVKDFAGSDGITAQGNLVGYIGGIATASSTAFNSTSATFTSADVGKLITIDGAGSGGGPYTGTIASVTDANDIVLSSAPATSTPYTVIVGATTATAQSGSGSYAPGDTITLTGGTAVTQAILKVMTTTVTSASVVSSGNALSGTTGPCTLSGTTGTLVNPSAGFFTVPAVLIGGQIFSLGTVAAGGSGVYSTNPTNLSAEPVTGCGLTGATLALTMGVVSVQIPTEGNYSVLPSNPVSQGSTSGSGTGATFNITFTNNTGNFRYYHDDCGAIAAAMTQAATLNAAAVYFPPGNYGISGCALPTFVRTPVGILGDGSQLSNVFVEPSYSGDVFSWDECWEGSAYPYSGNAVTKLPQGSGPKVKGISIFGDRSSSNVTPAFDFIDRAENVVMEDTTVFYLRGNAIRTGTTNLTTEGLIYESHFGPNIKFFNDGAGASYPVVDINSNASIQSSNELSFDGMDIYAPAGPGLVVRNNNAGVPEIDIKFNNLRVEGEENNYRGYVGDLVRIGDTTETGSEHGVYFGGNTEILSGYTGYSGMHLTAASSTYAPQTVYVDGVSFNGTMAGNALRVDYGSSLLFRIRNLFSNGTNIVVGANPNTAAPITFDDFGMGAVWSWSEDATAVPYVRLPNSRYGITTSGTSSTYVKTQLADGGTAGGVQPGINAVDLQTARFASNQSAVGSLAEILGGTGNRTAATGAIIIGGNGNLSSGFYSTELGGAANSITGEFSLGGGNLACDHGNYGAWAYASGDFNATCDVQRSSYILHCSTSSASACVATTSGGAAGATNCVNIPNNTAYALVARMHAIDNTDWPTNNSYAAAWGGGSIAPHFLTRGVGASTTLLDGATSTVSPDSTPRTAGTGSTASATLAADTTNGCLNATFTPPSGNTATWYAEFTVDVAELAQSSPPANFVVTLSNSSFTGGSPSGTTVGTISTTVAGAAFKGTLTVGGVNASSFQILNGTTLATNGVVPSGSYSITITATQSGATGSPYTTGALPITGH